jgi:hypothetical protein
MNFRRFFSAESGTPRNSKPRSKKFKYGFFLPLLVFLPYCYYVFSDRFQYHEEKRDMIRREHAETRARIASGKELE